MWLSRGPQYLTGLVPGIVVSSPLSLGWVTILGHLRGANVNTRALLIKESWRMGGFLLRVREGRGFSLCHIDLHLTITDQAHSVSRLDLRRDETVT